MKYPTISEYIESLSCASDNFATLSPLDLIIDTQGRPVYTKEKHCVIFRMKDGNSNIEYDVKCFTGEQVRREILYEQISNDQVVWFPKGIEFYDKELFVDTANSDDNEFPIVVTPHCKTTNIISFISTNIDNIVLLSKLTYSFSMLFSWVYEKDYSWYELNIDSLSVDEDGHIFISKIDEINEASNKSNNTGNLSAVLILLSLKAISKDKNLFDANHVRPQILFDVDKRDDLPSSEIIGKLLKTGDPDILSIIGAIFIHLGKGNYCGIQSGSFKVTLPSENKEDKPISLAEGGGATRQVELAKQYWEKEMYEESFKWYEQAAFRDNADALYGLGLCYRKGLGTEKDLAKSFQCFLRAAESGSVESQFALAEAYYFGWGVCMNQPKALELYYKAAQKGHAMSEFMIGHHLMSNHREIDSSFAITSKRDTVKAFEWFMKSAQKGYHPAQRRIGAFYETGTDPCIRNISKAMEWYQKAAAQGNDKALFAIGRLYANGLDERTPDNKKAYEYYLQSANKGFREAQYRVGIALLFGKGIPKDKDTAVEWIRKSADQGCSAAKQLIYEIEHNEENAEETEATGLEIASALVDEYGVLYSQDGKKLLIYSIEEGYVGEEFTEGARNMFDEESEFGSIKQLSLSQYKVKDGTEIICKNAFYECESLQSITFPQSLKRIGDEAFSQCENLEHVGINEGLEEIGYNAFNGCVNLSLILLPHSLKKIFDGCTFTGVQNIVSNSEKYICEDNCLFTSDFHTLIYFFQNGENYLEIPYGVETIGAYAFSESDIRYVEIPESVIEIEYSAFSHCMNLEDIYIPQSIIEIGDSAFHWCKNLNEVNLHRGLEIIGRDAFAACEDLEYIKIPDTVREVQDAAFAFTSIKSVVLPKNLEILGYDPFISCPLGKIKSLSDRFTVKDMAIYTDNGKTFVNYYGKESKFEIPIGVEKIADCALASTYSLRELIIPNTVKEIGNRFLMEVSPDKIIVPSRIKDLLIDKIRSYLVDHVFVIEDDSN